MADPKKFRIYVAVFKGVPVDSQSYRHTGLQFVSDDKTEDYFCHVHNDGEGFRYEQVRARQPENSNSFAEKILVAKVENATMTQLLAIASDTPIRNDDPEFNCHMWVHLVLQNMVRAGHITASEADYGLDEMMRATVDAPDDAHAYF